MTQSEWAERSPERRARESPGGAPGDAERPPYPEEAAWFAYADGRWTISLSTAARRRFDDYADCHPTERAELERKLRINLPPWVEIDGSGRRSTLAFEAGAPIPAALISETSWNADHRNVVALNAAGELIATGACESSVDRTVETAGSILRTHCFRETPGSDGSRPEDRLDE